MTAQPDRRRPPAVSGVQAAAWLRLLAALGALVAGQAVLWRAGSALPSLRFEEAGYLRTFAEAEPLALAAGLLRLVGLAVGAVLLATTALGVVARCCGAARLVARVDRWTPSGLRRLLDAALGVGLAASIGLTSLPATADPGAPAPATLRRLPELPLTTTTLRRLPDGPVPSQGGPSSAAGEAPGGQAPAPPARSPAEVVVRPGDSFWRLAERHEAERLGRQPTEAEVGDYWHRIIAVNRHLLAVPGDPDLLFPGQVLIVP